MPKLLLRGVIDFGDGRATQDQLNVNFRHLLASNYDFKHPDERKLWTFIKGYVQVNGEVPASALIKDHFEKIPLEDNVYHKLLDVKAVETLVRTHYVSHLKTELKGQKDGLYKQMYAEVFEIADKGMVVTVGGKRTVGVVGGRVSHIRVGGRDVRYHGPADAERYRQERIAEIETLYAEPVEEEPSAITSELPAPTPFPLAVFPTRIAEYVRAVADTYEVPTDMVAFCAMQVMALASQRKLNVRILQDWRQPCILWTLVVAPSGQKKTPVYDVLMRPVWRWTTAQHDAHEAETKRIAAAIKTESARGKEAQRDRIAELQTELEELAVAKEVAYQDITPAMLTLELKRQERKVIANGKPAKVSSFCLSDHDRNRLTDFKGRFNAAENEMSILHNGYDASVIKYHRVGEGGNAKRIHVEQGRIGLFCLSHPSSWDKILDPRNNYRDGAIGRLTVYVHPPVQQIDDDESERVPPPLDPQLQDEWDALITALLTDQPTTEVPDFGEVALPEAAPSMIEIDVEGQRWIRDVQRRRRLAVNADNVLHPYLTWVDKWPSKMARMYGVLTYARQVLGEAPPEDKYMEHLSLTVLLQAVHALGPRAAAPSASTELQEADKLAKKLLKTAQETGRWVTSVRDVGRGSNLPAAKAKRLLQMLDEAGHVTMIELDRNRVEVRITRPKPQLVAAAE